MNRARILCLDFGKERIGLAKSDPLGVTAQGLESLQNRGEKEILRRLKEIVEEEEIGKIVVGYPKKLDNTLGQAGEEVQRFAAILEKGLGIPVCLWDERLTTAAVHQLLKGSGLSYKKKKRVIDRMSAQLILQSYLDHQGKCKEKETRKRSEDSKECG